MGRKTTGPIIGQEDLGGRAGRRGGGRAARVAMRQEGPAAQAVRPGMEGGAFRPLSQGDIVRIHAAALDILADIGIGDPTRELIDIAVPQGCTLNEHGRA
jgi:trimethylamine--corrinoid protein Co-methyltransferase